MLVPATVTAMVVMTMAMMTASLIARRAVLALILGGNGHAGGSSHRAADDGTIAATHGITDCCTCCTTYCTTKNRICCRAGLGCCGCQAEGNYRNPFIHLHDSLIHCVSGGSLVKVG